jgi:hypothetical protein
MTEMDTSTGHFVVGGGFQVKNLSITKNKAYKKGVPSLVVYYWSLQ